MCERRIERERITHALIDLAHQFAWGLAKLAERYCFIEAKERRLCEMRCRR